MYTISFNIFYKSTAGDTIINKTPYLISNENINTVFEKIRNIVDNDFIEMIKTLKIQPTTLFLGLTTFSSIEKRMHFFEISAYKIRELQQKILG